MGSPQQGLGVADRIPDTCRLAYDRPAADLLVFRLSGAWRIGEMFPSPDAVRQALSGSPALRRLAFDTQGVTTWDSRLVAFAGQIIAAGTPRGLEVDRSGLPAGVQQLLALAAVVPARKDPGPRGTPPSFVVRVGLGGIAFARRAVAMLAFLGEAALLALTLLRGHVRVRRGDLLQFLQECGAQALPIVSLISFLVGVIMAYVGAIQLRQVGAQVYVADMVGIAMTRELGAMMTAIVLAGRTGAAFAAQLGTMQVNEEIDALTTFGMAPMEFLVLPRLLALACMMPLLTLYADLLGILGGAAVGLGLLKLGGMQYYLRTAAAVDLHDLAAGVMKGVVFGILVAIAGCLRGMQCGRSSAAVGRATTAAVVTGIVAIIVADAVLTVTFDLLGF
jgi:phospholipid/cholesterol/gamma-HCH transport system permease protein